MHKIASIIVIVSCALFPVFGETPTDQEVQDAKMFNLALANHVSLDNPVYSMDKDASAAGSGLKQKNPWIAAGLDWALPGAGRLYNGTSMLGGIVNMLGMVGLIYVENVEVKKLDEDHGTKVFPIMFASVLVANTGLAIDTYRMTVKRNEMAGK